MGAADRNKRDCIVHLSSWRRILFTLVFKEGPSVLSSPWRRICQCVPAPVIPISAPKVVLGYSYYCKYLGLFCPLRQGIKYILLAKLILNNSPVRMGNSRAFPHHWVGEVLDIFSQIFAALQQLLTNLVAWQKLTVSLPPSTTSIFCRLYCFCLVQNNNFRFNLPGRVGNINC